MKVLGHHMQLQLTYPNQEMLNVQMVLSASSPLLVEGLLCSYWCGEMTGELSFHKIFLSKNHEKKINWMMYTIV